MRGTNLRLDTLPTTEANICGLKKYFPTNIFQFYIKAKPSLVIYHFKYNDIGVPALHI